MEDAPQTPDQVAAKQALDTACSCGSGKKYGFCHGASDACWCTDGIAGKIARESHYDPANTPAEQQIAAEPNDMPANDVVIASREDDDDGGDFMVE